MTDANDKQAIIQDLLTRGVENVIPSDDELRDALQSDKVLNVYFGIDPTAVHIHLGHAFNLRKLQQLVELGHNVTFLIGDFTARVGDTSDKNDERPQLSPEQISQNVSTFQNQASKFLDFSKVKIAHNSEWLSKLTLQDVMETASEFSVNDFVSRELIRKRLDDGKRVGLIETLYPLMQGYDSYHLQTDLQLGATDQTFNMQAGRTLIKRRLDKESFVLASGYLPGTDGRKMSKSWGNAIWLDDTPEDVFGKVMRIADDLLEDYFVIGTNLPLDFIKEIMSQLEQGDRHPMEVKKQLARQITKELCGEEAVADAEAHFVSATQQKEATEDAPSVKLSDVSLTSGEELLDLLLKHGLVPSKSQGRRLFEQDAIRLNETSIAIDEQLDFNPGTNQIRVGKRRYLVVEYDS